jgi:hypothetical protein
MKALLNQNVLAMILGMAIILGGILTFYLFQKYLFGQYRRKVGNTMKPDRKVKK